MTSKEALDYLTSKVFTGENPTLEAEAEVCKEIISKDLERLEVLEKELETSQTEKAQIIDLIKKKIAYLENGVFLTSADYFKGAIRVLKELLKEVLE